jgi:mono/diheme cytochrome c family protein
MKNVLSGFRSRGMEFASCRRFDRMGILSHGLKLLLASAPGLFLGMVPAVFAAGPAPAGKTPEPPDDDRAGIAFFEQNIRPLLAEHCYQCHSAQAKKVRGGLRLDSRAGWAKGGDSGPALVPGKPDGSLLIQAVRYQDEVKMPPKGKLAPRQIDLLVQWVRQGAPDPRTGPAADVARKAIDIDQGRKFWAFRPLTVSAPPPLKDGAAWCRTPIDDFILGKLRAHGLTPNPAADRATLIRRVYFDLLGLPPTPEEIDAFVKDPDPSAYERLLDQLLDSPHYGERWGRHWMDVARFAESHGYEQDYDRKHAYPYRDFLIQALSQDLPYDQFVRWQLAGDELAPDDPLALAATGFLGGGAFPTQLTEAEFESARYDELDDMTGTTGVAFLGLSIGCARCHDHKFDPIPTQDYFRLAATFTTTIRSEIDLALRPGAKPVKVQVSSEGFPPTKHHADERGFPHFYKETYFLQRGDVRQKKEAAVPGFLQVLERNGKSESTWRVEPPPGWTRTSFRRAALAHWLTDAENGAGHLAARVIVNRLWQHHFGRGLVATPNDFGAQGERPTHPELLDWLAADLIEHGWRLKRLHKLMMTSAAYVQDSRFDESRAGIDRENIYLWRRTPRRLEAEAVRDALLSVGGLLDPRMYGPGTLDPNMRRRSVYYFIKRSQLIPLLMLLDWPEHLVSIGRRSVTTTAPQALLFLNSPQARQCAEGFAKRLPASPVEAAVERGYRLAFGRPPSTQESRLARDFLARQTAAYRKAGQADPENQARVDFCQTMMSMNEFIYVD